MKKLLVSVLVLALFILGSTAAWGLNSPEVLPEQGSLTLRYANDYGVIAGGSYGFADKLAVTADLGEDDFTRISLKYGVSPTLALEAGLFGSGSSRAFLGINGAAVISQDLKGILQLDLSVEDNELTSLYELGLILNLDDHLDLRGGFIGELGDESTTNLQLGLGYRF